MISPPPSQAPAPSNWGFNMTPAQPGDSFTPAEPKAGEPCQECMAAKALKEVVIHVRISLFFDGTLNNRDNTEDRESPYAVAGSSYLNAVSNIGILDDCGLNGKGPGADHHEPIYIAGIGTQTAGKDTLLGKALGMGDAGILAKVEQGIAEAVSNITVAVGSKTLVWVHLDCFGFSRGAAAARNCVHQAIVKGLLDKQLKAAGVPPGSVKCKFVGLYDTVASYGVAHYNDTSDLKLDCLAVAEKVVQLAAAEEHRANFRLTNILSAGGKGESHFLPGVHSDVGGGYNDGAEENVLLFDIALVDPRMGPIPGAAELYQREIEWLTSSGWYTTDQLSCHRALRGTIRGVKSGISNLYSRIPLQIMGEFARKHGVPIADDLQRDHAVPTSNPVLKQAYAEIKAKVDAKSDGSPEVWFKENPAGDAAWHKALRSGYFHFSSDCGSFGLGPERQGRGYVRRRVIQNG